MYSRHISPLLVEALADTPVVLLNGARQTGKSTLAQSLAISNAFRYLTLDDRVVLAAARDDPVGFVAGLSGPVILDEIQRAPDIFLPIKAEVDRDRRPGRFMLTGSANVCFCRIWPTRWPGVWRCFLSGRYPVRKWPIRRFSIAQTGCLMGTSSRGHCLLVIVRNWS
jgi:hypothetical protein